MNHSRLSAAARAPVFVSLSTSPSWLPENKQYSLGAGLIELPTQIVLTQCGMGLSKFEGLVVLVVACLWPTCDLNC